MSFSRPLCYSFSTETTAKEKHGYELSFASQNASKVSIMTMIRSGPFHDSYGILHRFDKQSREKRCLYRATQETAEILLQHIHHLLHAEKACPLPSIRRISRNTTEQQDAALRKLGEWADVSGDTTLPLLAAAEGMKWYES